MADIYKNAIDEIIKTIQDTVAREIKKYKFDESQKGIVTQVLSNNRYLVNIRGLPMEVPCVIGVTLNIGDVVYVKFPCGNRMEGHIYGVVKNN